mmetsp:Transcript_158760/g.281447  ORF Transcript_158760/g.281447 Transcript_158760/m.281447 type:complete len:803 (+) Transcript_158760:52-2460(+)
MEDWDLMMMALNFETKIVQQRARELGQWADSVDTNNNTDLIWASSLRGLDDAFDDVNFYLQKYLREVLQLMQYGNYKRAAEKLDKCLEVGRIRSRHLFATTKTYSSDVQRLLMDNPHPVIKHCQDHGHACTTLAKWCATALCCSSNAVATNRLRDRHLVLLTAVQHLLSSLGRASVPKSLVWRFLRNPFELIVMVEAPFKTYTMHTISLQTGCLRTSLPFKKLFKKHVIMRNVWDFHVALQGPKITPGFCGGSSRSSLFKEKLSDISLEDGVRITASPVNIPEEHESFEGDSFEEKFEEQPLWWLGEQIVKCGYAPCGTMPHNKKQDRSVILDSHENVRSFRAGVEAVLCESSWAAIAVRPPSANRILQVHVFDLSSGMSNCVFEEKAADLIGLVAADSTLVVGACIDFQYNHIDYTSRAQIVVFQKQEFGEPCIFRPFRMYAFCDRVRVHAFAFCDTNLAIVLEETLLRCGRTDLLCWDERCTNETLSTRGVEQYSINDEPVSDNSKRLHGAFTDVVLGRDLMITLARNPRNRFASLVQMWSLHGEARCLYEKDYYLDSCDSRVWSMTLCTPNTLDLEACLHSLSTLYYQDKCEAEVGTVIDEELWAEAAFEQPARIDPEEARAIASEMWASGIERLTETAVLPDVEHSNGLRVLLLQFSRHPKVLEDALLQSAPARTAVERGVDIQPSWSNGAKIFVEGISLQNLEEALGDDELRPRHLVILEEDEQDIYAALDHLPYNIKKLKPGVGRSMVPTSLELCNVSSEGEHEVVNDAEAVIEIAIKGTFIHMKSTLSSRSVATV